jgi:hypothetical protein
MNTNGKQKSNSSTGSNSAVGIHGSATANLNMENPTTKAAAVFGRLGDRNAMDTGDTQHADTSVVARVVSNPRLLSLTTLMRYLVPDVGLRFIQNVSVH